LLIVRGTVKIAVEAEHEYDISRAQAVLKHQRPKAGCIGKLAF
jgi:hypothetical protein